MAGQIEQRRPDIENQDSRTKERGQSDSKDDESSGKKNDEGRRIWTNGRALQGLIAFCAAILGALLAFLWFNINPARFFMGDTGAMGLGITLGVVAMLTNMALLLPIVGSIFVLESLSVVIQLTSKKLRGKKIFRSTPIHHHFEAIGWSEPKIVMRAWVIAAMSAVVGVAVALLDVGL